MKPLASMLLFAVLALPSFADEKPLAKAIPQARPRLDPATHASVLQPANTASPEVGTATAMSPFVVRDTPLISKAPQQEKQPDGPFSLLKGGRFIRKDIGPVRFEAGVWPYVDIMGADAGFKTPAHVGVGLLRLSW